MMQCSRFVAATVTGRSRWFGHAERKDDADWVK